MAMLVITRWYIGISILVNFQAMAQRSSAQLQRPGHCSHRPSPAVGGWREPGDPGVRVKRDT